MRLRIVALALIAIGMSCRSCSPAALKFVDAGAVVTSKMTEPTAEEMFEGELNRRGLEFSKLDPSSYRLQVNGMTVTANLENVAKDYARDRDPLTVSRFVDQIVALQRDAGSPSWASIRPLLTWQLEPINNGFEGAIRDVVTPSLARTVVIADSEQGTLAWVTKELLSDWSVTEDTVRDAATENFSALLRQYPLEKLEVGDGVSLGVVPLPGVYNALKASVIVSANFKDYVKPSMGWPVYAVVPCRDFIYVISAKDQAFLGRVGSTVIREHDKSGYPLTTEVLKISDAGVEPIGSFNR